MIEIVVCDDNPLHLNHTISLIRQTLRDVRIHIDSYTSAEDLYAALEEGTLLPSIAVLDIKMSGDNGIHLAERLNQVVPGCQIIFITGYAEFASAVYETRHIWFVLKEQADRFLPSAIERALQNLSAESSGNTVTIRTQGKLLTVSLANVIHIERVGRRYQVNLIDTQLFTSRNPVDLTGKLLRCHQGYWVNLDHVTGLDHNEFLLSNGSKVPIGRTFRDAARSAFFDRFTA